LPLRGDEIRACWDAAAPLPDVAAGPGVTPVFRPEEAGLDRTPVRKLEFVEVRSAPPKTRRRTAARPRTRAGARVADGLPADADPTDDAALASAPLGAGGWSLWGDAEA
jgi:hypothetical protein